MRPSERLQRIPPYAFARLEQQIARVVPDHHDVEDLVQESTIKIAQGRCNLRSAAVRS